MLLNQAAKRARAIARQCEKNKGEIVQRCSLNDAYQVTVNSSDLGLRQHFLSKGQEVYCRIDGIPVVFTVNRENGLTLITQTFPRRFELPDMSEPVFHTVSYVRVL